MTRRLVRLKGYQNYSTSPTWEVIAEHENALWLKRNDPDKNALSGFVDNADFYEDIPEPPKVGETWKLPYGYTTRIEAVYDDGWVRYSNPDVTDPLKHSNCRTVDSFTRAFTRVEDD